MWMILPNVTAAFDARSKLNILDATEILTSFRLDYNNFEEYLQVLFYKFEEFLLYFV